MPTREGFSDEVANVKKRRRKNPVLTDDQTGAPLPSVPVCIEDFLSVTDRPQGVSVLRYVEVLNSCSLASLDLFLSYFHSVVSLENGKSPLTIFLLIRYGKVWCIHKYPIMELSIVFSQLV
jgi:hypothetical protein